MRIICLADTQEKPEILNEYFHIAQPLLEKADLIVHLGDGIILARPFLKQYPHVIYVKGNHDPTNDLAKYEYEFYSIRMHFIHGEGNPWREQPNIWLNKLRNKLGLPPQLDAYYSRLYKKYQGQPEVLIYGHTHIPKIETVGYTTFFCPGGLPPKRLLFSTPPAIGEIKTEVLNNKPVLDFVAYALNIDAGQLTTLLKERRSF